MRDLCDVVTVLSLVGGIKVKNLLFFSGIPLLTEFEKVNCLCPKCQSVGNIDAAFVVPVSPLNPQLAMLMGEKLVHVPVCSRRGFSGPSAQRTGFGWPQRGNVLIPDDTV